MIDDDNFRRRRCAFHTLGCKLNFSETSDMSRRLVDNGFVRVDFDDVADVYVINTCSVTEEANKKCRQTIHRCLRKNKDAFVVVTGCYAQLQSANIAQMPGVDLVLGSNQKHLLAELVSNGIKQKDAKIISSDILKDRLFVGSFSSGDRTRSFLKIQDGCDYFCSYCTIPMARGLSRSGTVSETVALARKAAGEGAKEIVLTGVNIGDFGRKNGSSFLELIQALEEIDSVERYRISSIEPNLLTDEIIAHVAKSSKFMPHFHIPLQSGSDEMLKLMHRRYTTEHYAHKVGLVKSLMPDAFIGVDVIVGVGGETEQRFMQSHDFLASIDFTQLHVFTYSERPGTKALELRPVVPNQERHRRNAVLHELSEQHRKAFYKENVGKKAKVLVESSVREGLLSGFTENYIRVELPASTVQPNTIVDVELTGLSLDGMTMEAKLL